MARSLHRNLIAIRADRYVRGVDRSEGTGSFTRSHGPAPLSVAIFSEGKATEHKKHGCVKEFADACDDVVRGTTLDSGHGGRADTQIE